MYQTTQIQLLLVTALLIAGCDGGKEEEAVIPAPVEIGKKHSSEHVVNRFQTLGKLREPLPDVPVNFGIQEQTALKTAHSTAERLIEECEDPDAARAGIADLLGARIEEAVGKRSWSHVAPYVKAYKTFRPQDTVYDQYMREAQLHMNRPRFALRGFLHDYNSGTTTGIFRIRDPNTGETLEERIRVGETVRGIHFVRVIGKDDAAEVEYEGTGETLTLAKGDDFQ